MGRHLPGKKVPSLERKVRKGASRAFLQLDGKNPIKMALKKSKNEKNRRRTPSKFDYYGLMIKKPHSLMVSNWLVPKFTPP